MEPFLVAFGEDMDQTTKQVLQNLINRKLKYNRYKNMHFTFLTIAILFCFLSFYFIYKTAIEPYNYSVLDMVSVFTGKSYFLLLIFIGFTLLGSVKIFFEKKEKSEKEYNDLRCEVIDKCGDLLPGNLWNERHKIFEYMKKKYNINLYHQSK
ncbi:DUF2663 family protein [Bacillus niameyensis]|uniref:DUF2663 family protein n=1 Tax=Bacillus niameyensis TaxID=1522308 RepID=UPI00078138DE|nr:DUF2663 family protein [Bacillus niameyensis]